MIKGTILAIVIIAVTIILVVIGTLWPVQTAVAYAGGRSLLRSSSTPQAAVENLADELKLRNWSAAYSQLANKAKFTEPQFQHDLTGYHLSLRSYATVEGVEVRPLHQEADQAEVQMRLHWSTVVGPFVDTRDLHLVRNGDRWAVEWPLVKQQTVPPQVIPVNYLRWDVIYPGGGDDWGAQSVEAPHVRVIDMHPVQRAEGVFVMGELLNEDVIPAHVSVHATLIAKDGKSIATEGSFDKICPTLLPKQVTPFLIKFSKVASLSDVGSIRLDPVSTLVPASADPVIEIQNQKLNPAPDASLTGQVMDESGEIVNIVHVLATFYNKTGQLVWVADKYIDRALLPQTPASFNIHIPEDLARQISTERTITATYTAGGFQ